MRVLDNGLFDDGSLECRTFWVCTAEDSYMCEIDTIRREFSEYFKQIVEAKNDGKHHISLQSGDTVEIQWD